MGAAFVSFAVSFGISFFLTPYIVRSLGPEAYGFIGLTTNILGYTSLITIALNSMAGRFVTIKYTAGDIENANKYYASVFYSNIFLASVILLFTIGCVTWLEYMIEIPKDLIFDVKLLFSLLAFNQIVGLVFGIWGVATFIKNRLDLSNIRGIIGNLLNATILVTLFTAFSPHIWYMGVAGVFMTLYTTLTNQRFARRLTPELVLNRANYEWIKVKELLLSGIWNVVSKLGSILSSGLDLLIANICIGATAMGYFALTKNVPFMILGLFQMISGVFSPILTNLYAQGKKEEMKNELFKSIRIMSMFTAIPLTCLYIYGDYFYALWLPTEDCKELQMLTILGTFALPYTLPLEALWNIFTITNKLKYSTIFSLVESLVVFSLVMSSMIIVEDTHTKLIILACTRSICGVVRGFIFLPIYGAHCLELKKSIFYKTILTSLLYIAICLISCYIIRQLGAVDTWFKLVGVGILVTIICVSLSILIILSESDRKFLYKKITHQHA